jgi:hypothetical protein
MAWGMQPALSSCKVCVLQPCLGGRSDHCPTRKHGYPVLPSQLCSCAPGNVEFCDQYGMSEFSEGLARRPFDFSDGMHH